MPKREFLQLAHNYNPKKHGVGGWLMSEKLDGMRCFWDGGITRGQLKSEVPWANTLKDSRYKIPPIATGLWTRYGNVVHAPDWWLDKLPNVPLDGELYTGPEDRQALMSISKKIYPGAEWYKIKYMVFDALELGDVIRPGSITSTNFTKDIPDLGYERSTRCYYQTYRYLMDHLIQYQNSVFNVLEQETLPHATPLAEKMIEDRLFEITDVGGEGLIIRSPGALWEPCRSHKILKVKKCDDAEGTVIGYVSGKIGLEGKLRGKLGALVLKLKNGKTMELSGFTHAERKMSDTQWCYDNPGAYCPEHVVSLHYPIGTVVTFRYRGLSRDGIPQEARYWRKHA